MLQKRSQGRNARDIGTDRETPLRRIVTGNSVPVYKTRDTRFFSCRAPQFGIKLRYYTYYYRYYYYRTFYKFFSLFRNTLCSGRIVLKINGLYRQYSSTRPIRCRCFSRIYFKSVYVYIRVPTKPRDHHTYIHFFFYIYIMPFYAQTNPTGKQ